MCIGCGILALPFATTEAGLIGSPVLMLIVAILNGISSCMLLRCEKATNFIDIPNNISSTYAKLGYRACGWIGVYVIDTSIIVTLLGVCVTYIITFAQLMSSVFNISINNLIIVFCLCVYPISCSENIKRLSLVSILGMGCLLISVAVILIYGFYSYNSDHLIKNSFALSYWPESVSGLLNFIGISTFCIDICTPIFPIEESLLNKKEIYSSILISIIFVWSTYCIFGNLGAILYSNREMPIESNILLNLPNDPLIGTSVRLALALVLFIAFTFLSVFIYTHLFKLGLFAYLSYHIFNCGSNG